jgi:hypothetical protein
MSPNSTLRLFPLMNLTKLPKGNILKNNKLECLSLEENSGLV